MSEVVSLGERLRRRREELGLSQAQVARELDVARTAYRLWEMEAAKPAPDRWRLISRWLGVSVATMLVADDLVGEDESKEAELITGRFGPGAWDDESGRVQGGFFEQERELIARAADDGRLSGSESATLEDLLSRVEARNPERPRTHSWPAANLVKDLPIDQHAPALARAAVLVVAAGVPTETLRDAQLLTSDLVANSVRLGPQDADAVRLRVSVRARVLRVEVAEATPGSRKASDPERGRDLDLVIALASRWGGERNGATEVTWFELDLPEPGATSTAGR